MVVITMMGIHTANNLTTEEKSDDDGHFTSFTVVWNRVAWKPVICWKILQAFQTTSSVTCHL